MTTQHIKYQHFVLSNNNVLTIASVLDKENSTICYGYTICNTKTDRYIKKIGNQLALQRLTVYHNCLNIPVFSNVEENFQSLFLNHNFLSWMIINSIVKDNSKIEKNHYGLTFSEDTYRSLVCLEFYLSNCKVKPTIKSFIFEIMNSCNFKVN